jgi:choice-of-anchor C domain-containing protein
MLMRNKPLLFVIAILLFSVGVPAPAKPVSTANLIKNGGFDLGPQPSYFTTLTKGSTAIPGWTVTLGTIDIIGPNWHDADGGKNAIDLDGTPGPGVIGQWFATAKGAKYMVSFALASNPECGPTVKRLLAAAGPANRHYYAFDSSHASDAHMGWQTKSFSFKASGSRTALTFNSLDPQGSLCGPAIDAVRVWKVK